MRKKNFAWIRPFLPVIIGLSLGFSMSLVRMPLNRNGCQSTADHVDRHLRSVNSLNLGDTLNLQEGNVKTMGKQTDHEPAPLVYDSFEDFEPRIITDPGLKPKVDLSLNKKKIVRTRYISTELGIREKLYAAVVSSRISLNNLAVASNKTFAHHMQKLEFYLAANPGVVSDSKNTKYMSLQTVKADTPVRVLLEMLDHIFQTFKDDYNWFFLVKDSTYVQAERLNELVNHISINRRLYMGYPISTSIQSSSFSYCSLDNGILLSRLLFIELVPNLHQCLKNTESSDPSVWLGYCIYQTFQHEIECQNNQDDQNYYTYTISHGNFEADNENSQSFKQAITVSGIKIPSTFYKLHHRFSQFEIDLAYKEIESIQEEIQSINSKLPPEERQNSWPIGINPPFKPTNRWDIIVWDYFTEDYSLTCPGEVPKCELSGIDKLDIQNILQTAMERLNDKYNPQGVILEKKKLVNGYKRFDPQRGMEYTLDLLLSAMMEGEKEKVDISHRVHLLRPLSQVEIIPMPYVTESAKIHMVLPITAKEAKNFDSFIHSFARVCLDSGENVELSIVFVYNPADAKKIHESDVFSGIKEKLQDYETKYQKKKPSTSSKLIPWVSIKTEVTSQLKIMDVIAKKHLTDTLFLLTSVNVVLDTEFLNRCRMNAIQGWQAFFPIPFSQYNTEIIFKNKPAPKEIEIKPNYGHFDLYSFDEACFYNSDYMAARTKLSDYIASNEDRALSDEPMDTLDIYTLMVKYSELHIFRAVEPQLKRRYAHRHCHESTGRDLFQKCERSNAEGLASRTQLAMELYPEDKKL